MLDLTAIPSDLLEPVASVVTAILHKDSAIDPADLMVVGARCRDILHAAQGHQFVTAATHDLDLALALRSREDYSKLVAGFARLGDSGIRYAIADATVDLLPFGEIEDPSGTAAPVERGEPLSVWGFSEIHVTSTVLPLSETVRVRIPTVAGYAATKLVAWLDRREPRDAADLALAAFWYADDPAVAESLWASPTSDSIIVDEDFDLDRAAVHRLGLDVATTLGPIRVAELVDRWSGDDQAFIREFRLIARSEWTGAVPRRKELIRALSRGMTTAFG